MLNDKSKIQSESRIEIIPHKQLLKLVKSLLITSESESAIIWRPTRLNSKEKDGQLNLYGVVNKNFEDFVPNEYPVFEKMYLKHGQGISYNNIPFESVKNNLPAKEGDLYYTIPIWFHFVDIEGPPVQILHSIIQLVGKVSSNLIRSLESVVKNQIPLLQLSYRDQEVNRIKHLTKGLRKYSTSKDVSQSEFYNELSRLVAKALSARNCTCYTWVKYKEKYEPIVIDETSEVTQLFLSDSNDDSQILVPRSREDEFGNIKIFFKSTSDIHINSDIGNVLIVVLENEMKVLQFIGNRSDQHWYFHDTEIEHLYTFFEIVQMAIVDYNKSSHHRHLMNELIHELRGPIHQMINRSTLESFKIRKSKNYNKDIDDFYRSIFSSSQLMRNTISDIAEVYNSQKRLVKMFRNVDVLKVIKSAIDIVNYQAKIDKDISIDFNTQITSIAISTDESKLLQVLINLLHNAVRFSNSSADTPSGNIEVNLEYQNDGKTLAISVASYGLEIQEKEKEIIFNLHTRGHRAEAYSPQGIGVGLFVSRSIIELLGGKIFVKSIFNPVKFLIELPVNL